MQHNEKCRNSNSGKELRESVNPTERMNNDDFETSARPRPVFGNKTPSDTTLYTPALRKGVETDGIINKISNFVENI